MGKPCSGDLLPGLLLQLLLVAASLRAYGSLAGESDNQRKSAVSYAATSCCSHCGLSPSTANFPIPITHHERRQWNR